MFRRARRALWISNQAAGNATLYTLNGLTATRAGGPLVVTIPALPTPPNGPTPAHLIFANLNGTISAWAAASTPAAIEATTPGAAYTGLAIGGTVSAPFLYAANGKQNSIDVFDGAFTNVTGTTFAGKFMNPFSGDGLVPFNVQNIGGDIYVTCAPASIGANRTPQTMATAAKGPLPNSTRAGTCSKR